MKSWWRHRRLRIHLTLWYISAMIVILALYAAGVLTFVSRRASASLDSRIRADYAWAAEMWDRHADGTLTWFDPGSLPDEDSAWLQVWDTAGQLLFSTSRARRSPIPSADELAREASGHIVPIRSTQPPVRVLSRATAIDGQPVVIQVAQSEAMMQAELDELGFLLLVGLPVGVAAAGFGGYLLARRALRPVDLMAERADRSPPPNSTNACRWTSRATSSAAWPRCSTTRSDASKAPSARWRGSRGTSPTNCARPSPPSAPLAR